MTGKRRFAPNPRALIESIEKLEALFGWDLKYDGVVIYEVSKCCQQDLDNLTNPNLVKQASCIAFWINKLKPIRGSDRSSHFANEVLAFSCAHAMLLSRYRVEKRCLYRLFTKLVQLFRYEVLSAQVLGHIYENLYTRLADKTPVR